MSAKVALFALGSTSYALPVTGITHILSAPRIFPLPFLRSEFCGVFLHQGEIVPLLNLWKHFGVTGCPSIPQFTTVMMTEFGLIGLPAGQVRRIVDHEQGILEDAADEEGHCVFIYAETQYPLLDIDALIAVFPTREITPVLSSRGTKEA